jgi:hypothetical protein
MHFLTFELDRNSHARRACPSNTYVGWRGATRPSATQNAIANWESAIKNIPENQKVNLPVYEQALKALKEKS